ncbi:MAG TPA: YfcE family phosphodiesterase [Candidatus Acidoferrales bacterium]|jgi:putative phosphoesterase|nr:YfcE family phosphodiesterase [Candidatus Acidoferrales bacterium]
MRLAVLSDIHGNLTALEAVLADLKTKGVDLVVHGGDLVASGARPAEVIDIIQELGWPGVCGNTDEMLWRPEVLAELELKAPSKHGLRRVLFNDIAPTTRELLGEERVIWLRSLPTQWSGHRITVVHASPDDLWRAPLSEASDGELLTTYGGLHAIVVIYGHIHRRFVRKLENLTVANSGSVGLPYDGDPRASYALVENGAVTVRRVEYDVEREVQELRRNRYPRVEWLASILRTAQYRPPS